MDTQDDTQSTEHSADLFLPPEPLFADDFYSTNMFVHALIPAHTPDVTETRLSDGACTHRHTDYTVPVVET